MTTSSLQLPACQCPRPGGDPDPEEVKQSIRPGPGFLSLRTSGSYRLDSGNLGRSPHAGPELPPSCAPCRAYTRQPAAPSTWPTTWRIMGARPAHLRCPPRPSLPQAPKSSAPPYRPSGRYSLWEKRQGPGLCPAAPAPQRRDTMVSLPLGDLVMGWGGSH